MLGETVDPNARGRDRFPEAEFNSRASDVFAVHGADRLHYARYRSVLTKRVTGSATAVAAAALLDVDLDYTTEMFKFFS